MSEWKTMQLGDIISVCYGKDHKQVDPGNIPIYGSGGIMRFGNKALCNKPSVLIPRKGSLNNIFYVDVPFWTVDTMFWTDIDTSKIDPKFLYYNICKFDFASYDVGSAIPSLSVPVINGIEVTIPNLDTQKKIASILSSLDDKIETNRAINARLEELAAAIFKSWFIDFEPFAGSLPPSWKSGKLSDIASVIMGLSPSGDSINTESGVIFYQGSTEFGTRFPSIKKYTTAPTRFAEPFSVLLSVRAPVGALNVTYQKCCIGRGLASISSKYKSFVLYSLKEYQTVLDRYNGEGTVFGCIKKSDIENIPILIPPSEILSKFESIMQSIDNQIYNYFCEISRLSALRDTLLPRLMSGALIPQ